MEMLIQLWNDWELQILVLLSFLLQVFLFCSGGLRQRSTNAGLRLLIWLAYLTADLVAVYALGLLSRQNTDTTTEQLGKSHSLTFFWASFLLIHLGGQDTVTAFSVEDNELWVRHLLNLLVQVGLALYVFWKSEARNHLLVSAVFVFFVGIIKYGERTLALKSASQKGLGSSTTIVEEEEEEEDDEEGEAAIGTEGARAGSSTTNVEEEEEEEEEGLGSQKALELKEQEQEQGYMAMVKFALSTSPGVRNLFSGRKLEQMERSIRTAFTGGRLYSQTSKDGGLVFKILEIELGMMYENLYTKAMVIRTLAGAILRIVALICLMFACGLFLIENKQWPHHTKTDVAITYALFGGSFCLEVCAIFLMVMMSTWTWALFRSWKWKGVSNAIWYVYKTVRPESRPLWSNSMGQYNFLHSCYSNENVIGKMMNFVGAKELWRNFRHTRRTNVEKEIKKLIFEDKCFEKLMSRRQTPLRLVKDICDATYLILRRPFAEAIISLHIYTDIFLLQCKHHIAFHGSHSTEEGQHQISGWHNTEKVQHLIRTCKTLSEYMCYLLAVHPDMLPVLGSASYVLDKASDTVAKIISPDPPPGGSRFIFEDHGFLEHVLFLQRMATDYSLNNNSDGDGSVLTEKSDPVDLAGFCFRNLSNDNVRLHPLESLQVLLDAWLGVLLYAAGKSPAEAHAKHLSMGGELLTFLWLHLAHLSHGDMGTTEIELHIQPEANLMDGRGRKKFIWSEHLQAFLNDEADTAGRSEWPPSPLEQEVVEELHEGFLEF